MHSNTKFIINWVNRMMNKTGFCGVVFSEVLAEYTEEAGNEDPSDEAVAIAKEWEKDMTSFIDYIRSSGRWCMNPTMGCRRFCEMWKGRLDE